MKELKRIKYLEELKRFQDTNFIKVLTGVRRCGKSTILKQFSDMLRSEGVDDKQIQFFNLERRGNYKYTENWTEFYDNLIKNCDDSKMNYIFLDEVQNIVDFEKLLDALYVAENIDLYVTGSNAYLLSSELNTLLSGRQIEIKVLPYSFAEFSEVRNDNSRNVLQKYLTIGSLPESVNLSLIDEENVSKYLDSINETVMQKDILYRQHLHNNDLLRRIALFLYDSIGSTVSANNIANSLKVIGVDVSNHTAQKILDMFCESYLFYKVSRYDIKGKRILKSQEKYYPVDLGLRNNTLGSNGLRDAGHQIECIVYFELLRRYRKVYIGKSGENEIDFVVLDKQNEYRYYQVAYTVKDESTLNRELKPLIKITDNYSKTLITTDEFEFSNNGIMQVNLENWLLDV